GPLRCIFGQNTMPAKSAFDGSPAPSWVLGSFMLKWNRLHMKASCAQSLRNNSAGQELQEMEGHQWQDDHEYVLAAEQDAGHWQPRCKALRRAAIKQRKLVGSRHA